MQLFINNWSATLMAAAAAAAAATQLEIDSASAARLIGLGEGDYYLLTLARVEAGQEVEWEVVKVTALSGSALTVERAQEGTDALEWAVGSSLSLRATAGTLAALQSSGGGGGGGGGSGRFGKPRLPPGLSFCPYQIAAGSSEFAQSFISGRAVAVPFELDFDMSVNGLGVYVGTANASAWVEIALYDSDAEGWPSQRLGAVEISAASAGHRMNDLGEPLSLQPGRLYWLAILPSQTVMLRGAGAPVIGPPGTSGSCSSLTRASTELPETWAFTASDFGIGGASPMITIRRTESA